MTNRFENTSALVTGGASGLGEATARLLATNGVRVVIVDRNADLGKAVADSIDGVFAEADVTSEEQVILAIEAASSLGSLRIAVNCAGIPSLQRTVGKDGEYTSAHSLDGFRRVVDVNLVGTFNVVRLAATAMSRLDPFDASGERGAILNTASVAAFDGQIGQIAYSASKAAITGFTLPLARDLAIIGVRVNTIAPGLIDTPIYGTVADPEAFKANLAKDALFPKRLGVPREFATMAWELLSNPYMNGEVVRVDAGIRLPPK